VERAELDAIVREIIDRSELGILIRQLQGMALGGGTDLASVDTFQTTASTSYTNLATVGPSLTIPEDGDYIVTVGAYQRVNGAGLSSLISYSVGGAAASDSDAAQMDTTLASNGASVVASRKKTLTAGTVLLAKYRASGGTALFGNRWIKYERVG
jgi:hypothetical protein